MLRPRKAFTPPPARPMLPSSSCTIAAVRMICDPERLRQPSAYRIIITRSGVCGGEHPATQNLSFVPPFWLPA